MARPLPTIESIAAGVDAMQQDQTRRNIEHDSEQEEHNRLVKALRDVLTEGKEGDKFVLLQRVPVICKDIQDIRKGQDKLSNDMWWIKLLGGGVLSIGALLAAKQLGI